MDKEAKGITSFIFGLLGFILCWIPLFGLLFNILGLVWYSGSDKKGLATAGLVLSIIGSIISLIFTIIMVVALLVGMAS